MIHVRVRDVRMHALKALGQLLFRDLTQSERPLLGPDLPSHSDEILPLNPNQIREHAESQKGDPKLGWRKDRGGRLELEAQIISNEALDFPERGFQRLP